MNYIIRYSVAKLFAAKFRLRSIAKVFAKAGKDLSRPIKNDATKTKKAVIGQTEAKIYEYLESIKISKKNMKDKSRI